MSAIQQPETPEELRRLLASAAQAKRSVEILGTGSKRLLAGFVDSPSIRISTAGLKRILQYEPRDLTISVEAGMNFGDLNRELSRNNQMIPLEGPWSDEGTVGGLIAANISGSRRRLYGTARDLVIGMKFATCDGKIVQSGGMVVKNVAGLDMGKMMIGSFGTLAAISSINFKLVPVPAVSRTLTFSFEDAKSVMEARDKAIAGLITPVAVDVLNPILSAQLSPTAPNLKGYTLALCFSGNQAVIERSCREAEPIGAGRALSPEEHNRFWSAVRNVTPRHLEKFKDGAVCRVSTTLSDCGKALDSVEGPGQAHAASGIVRGWFSRPETAGRWLYAAARHGWKGVVEGSGESARAQIALWPDPGPDFEIMKRVKHMFDPEGLLNRGRLYGRI